MISMFSYADKSHQMPVQARSMRRTRGRLLMVALFAGDGLFVALR